MKNLIVLFVFFLATHQFIHAQFGTVKSFYKISATTGGFTGLSGQNIGFGSVSTNLGDINKDGIDDIATNIWDPVSFKPFLAVLFMNSNGTVKSHKLIGEEQGLSGIYFSTAFTSSITNMGDLNGDGINDIAVGDTEAGGSNSRTGVVNIIYLNTDGTVKSFKQISRDVIASLPNNGSFGTGLANIGDLNNDGHIDLAVASNSEVLNGAVGCIYILFLDSVQNIKSFRKIGANTSGLNGDFSMILKIADGLGSIGDFNKDGVNDIAFYARFNKDSVSSLGALGGLIIAYLNTNGTVKSHSRINYQSNGLQDLIPNDAFGQSIVKLNDLDGDGVYELAVGAPFDTTYNVGRGGSVRILFMNADGTVKSAQKIDNLSGNFNQPITDADYFGTIGPLGDFNNDSIPDLLVGSSGKDEGGTNKGALYLLMLNGVPSVGLNDVRANRIQVNLYPNPAKYQVQVSCPYPVTQITITDVTGKTIHQQKNNEPIQVQTWQAGMYYLQVNTTQGTATQKIIKE
ncbi:MAG: FG-GAP-like repeat-containing protein [Bacteroidia bacterium]|nr:FG-GAP-like repeat-containing protein [Bacteroidia bacterium]